jgi:hypothetical protein
MSHESSNGVNVAAVSSNGDNTAPADNGSDTNHWTLVDGDGNEQTVYVMPAPVPPQILGKSTAPYVLIIFHLQYYFCESFPYFRVIIMKGIMYYYEFVSPYYPSLSVSRYLVPSFQRSFHLTIHTPPPPISSRVYPPLFPSFACLFLLPFLSCYGFYIYL